MPPVPASMTRQLLAAHQAGASRYGARGEERAAGTPIGVRVDHVACGEAEATLALLSLECLAPAAAGPLGFVALERDGLRASFDVGEEQSYVDASARARGWNVSRAGNGRAWGVYAARLAAPGRMVAGPPDWVRRVGAYGMLGIAADPVELAVTLAGIPLVRPIPEVVRVVLMGRAGPGVGGTDFAWMLASRLRGSGGPGVVELAGEGMTALPMHERIACARALDRATGWTALFPSDAVTRGALTTVGRESDWRAIAPPEEDAAPDFDLDVSNLDALAWDPLARAPVAARGASAAIRQVVLGPECELEELLLVARTVTTFGLGDDVALTLVAGTRAIASALGASGWTARLRERGVTVIDPGPDAEWLAERDPASTLVCGLTGDAPDAWQAGAAVCATVAVRGRLGDPREHALSHPMIDDDEPMPLVEDWPVPRVLIPPDEPAPAGEKIARDGLVPPRPLTPITDSLRGEILLRVPDDGTPVLAWGPRIRPLAHRLERLAGEVLVRADRGFATRAAARGGGFVLWQGAYRSGGRPLAAALALARLGVRVVLARGFEDQDRDALASLGVLPLTAGAGPGLERLAAGDEVELPDLPEGLEPRRPVVLRDLTRGQQLLLRHELDATQVSLVRAGGRLAAAAAALAAASH